MPITTDRYASLEFGPVTSRIYDRIKASGSPAAHPTFWSRHITKCDQFNVSLTADPGDSELSRAESALIAELFAADGSKDGFVLAEETHRDFPEWKDPGEGSLPIEVSEILTALGVSEDEAAHTESAIVAQRAARDLAI